MTNEQKERVKTLRRDGWGYKKIAIALEVSADTIKSFCRKEGLGGTLAAPGRTQDDTHCRECGRPLIQTVGMKKRKFCSTECRIKWWKAHPKAIKQKAVYTFTCPTCGRKFTSYGNAGRKYCSHECYVAARFKGGDRDDA